MIMNEMICIVRVQNNHSIVFFLLLFTLKWKMSKQKNSQLGTKGVTVSHKIKIQGSLKKLIFVKIRPRRNESRLKTNYKT